MTCWRGSSARLMLATVALLAGVGTWGAEPPKVSSDQTAKAISALQTSVDAVRSNVTALQAGLNSLSNLVVQQLAQRAPGSDDQRARLQALERDQAQLRLLITNVPDRLAALAAKVDRLLTNPPPAAVPPGGDPTAKLGPLLAGLSNGISSVAERLAGVEMKLKNLEDLPKEIGQLKQPQGTVPTSLKVAVWLNLLVGLGVLGVCLVLLRDRKSIANQVEAVVKDHIPEWGQALVSKFGPELAGLTRRVDELSSALLQAHEKHIAFLNTMETQSAKMSEALRQRIGEAISSFETAVSQQSRLLSERLGAAAVQSAVQEATRAWRQQAEAMLNDLQSKARQEFELLFAEAKAFWEADSKAETQRLQQSWNDELQQQRRQWQSRLEAELAEAKKAWSAHWAAAQRQWQEQIKEFEQTQAALWQGQLDAAAKKAGEVWTARLGELAAKAENLGRELQQNLSDTQSRLADLNNKIVAAYKEAKSQSEALADLAWPPFFREEPLANWRQRIEARLAQGDADAFDLFLAVGRFASAAREEPRDLRKVAETLHGVSAMAYRFWKATGANVLEAAPEWRSAFQNFLAAAGVPVDIILALEGDRFDMNSMLSVDSESASRIYVKEALSWIVRDKSGQTPKVLFHARVVTC